MTDEMRRVCEEVLGCERYDDCRLDHGSPCAGTQHQPGRRPLPISKFPKKGVQA